MERDIYTILGQRVRAHRLKFGWSQEELGERTSLHASYIGQIERGTKKISLASLQKLARALKIKISDLLIEDDVESLPSGWEQKIAGLIKDKPPKQQEYLYKLTKEFTRIVKKASK